MQQKFLPLFRIMGENNRTNPVSLLKDAMNMIGYNAGISRLPLTPGEEGKGKIRNLMKELDLL